MNEVISNGILQTIPVHGDSSPPLWVSPAQHGSLTLAPARPRHSAPDPTSQAAPSAGVQSIERPIQGYKVILPALQCRTQGPAGGGTPEKRGRFSTAHHQWVSFRRLTRSEQLILFLVMG